MLVELLSLIRQVVNHFVFNVLSALHTFFAAFLQTRLGNGAFRVGRKKKRMRVMQLACVPSRVVRNKMVVLLP